MSIRTGGPLIGRRTQVSAGRTVSHCPSPAYVHATAAVKQALSAGVKWGSWTLPTGLELGIIAAIGVSMLAVAMQQFGRTE